MDDSDSYIDFSLRNIDNVQNNKKGILCIMRRYNILVLLIWDRKRMFENGVLMKTSGSARDELKRGWWIFMIFTPSRVFLR
jgi:hypothetical protein